MRSSPAKARSGYGPNTYASAQAMITASASRSGSSNRLARIRSSISTFPASAHSSPYAKAWPWATWESGNVKIDERILAKRFDEPDREADAVIIAWADAYVFGPYPERAFAGLDRIEPVRQCDIERCGSEAQSAVGPHELAGHEVHRRRAEKIGHEVVGGLGIDFH